MNNYIYVVRYFMVFPIRRVSVGKPILVGKGIKFEKQT